MRTSYSQTRSFCYVDDMIRGLVLLAESDEHLPVNVGNPDEKPLLELALDATGGNQLRCADLLGINRNTLRKKLTDLNIEVTRRRKLM